MSNLSLKIASVIENRLGDAFEAHGILLKEEVCHRVWKGWMIYVVLWRYYVK